MPLVRGVQRAALGTYKARKRYRKELEQVGIKVPGAAKQSSKNLVNKVPLSSSLKHNDHMLFRLFKLHLVSDDDEEKLATENEVTEEADEVHGKAKTGLREMVSDMADQARTTLSHIQEIQERSAFWGDKSDEEFQFLVSQAKLLMQEKGVQSYAIGEGSIKPRERIGEVERSEEAMDDAVVEYSRSARLLSRFRKSTCDTPVASGAFMRPSVPSTNLLAARVSNELELVRNRMFRLDSMLKDPGHSNQLQVGRMSAIMTWKRVKLEAQENLLQPVECIQTAEEMMEARMRAASPSRSPGSQRRMSFLGGSRTVSPLSRSPGSVRLQADADSTGSSSGGVKFDDVRPKTAGSPLRLGATVSKGRPQTASGPARRKGVTISDGSRTAR